LKDATYHKAVIRIHLAQFCGYSQLLAWKGESTMLYEYGAYTYPSPRHAPVRI
jgi:hypothetical protein